MSYIVKNCPAFDKQYNECHSKIEPHKIYCQDCTDCVIKQVIGKCKDMASDRDYYAYDFANEILQLLDIEEIK